MQIPYDELKDFLDQKVEQYNRPEFIDGDPISIPHQFKIKEDIEIAGFLTATLSWGNRKSIIQSASLWMQLMEQSPYHFIMESSDEDMKRFQRFVHRTFNGNDCTYFISALRNIYIHHGGLESVFNEMIIKGFTLKESIIHFRKTFFEFPHLKHAEKHVADPSKNASAKRINMFLRWMVRNDKRGVDFGIWKIISPSVLFCPLDIHSGCVSRKLGLLSRKANDWKSVEELTIRLRTLDPDDPVKYDFALFGLGIFENF
jgi:uncharacterized protein (TIGR02757 family)